MHRIGNFNAIRPLSPTQAVRDADAGPARKALDSLVINFSRDLQSDVLAWEKTCDENDQNSRSLCVYDQAGTTSEEKIAGLMKVLATLVEDDGMIDLSTQIMVVGHGDETETGDLIFMSNPPDQIWVAAVPFLRRLRQILAGGLNREDWKGTLHVCACRAGILRKHFANAGGNTVLHAGNKIATAMTESYSACLRALSKETLTKDGLLRPQVLRMWESACQVTGENISLCGESGNLHHKVKDHDFTTQAAPEKKFLAAKAKLIHGSWQSFEKMLRGYHLGNGLLLFLAQSVLSHRNIERDHLQKIEVLIAAAGNVNQSLEAGATLLSLALDLSPDDPDRHVVEALLRHGANPWSKDMDGKFAWQYAHDSLMDLLSADPVDNKLRPAPRPRTVEADDQTFPWHAACARGDFEWLQQHPFNKEILCREDPFGNSPLAVAVAHGQWQLVRTLLEQGANPGVRLSTGDSLLAHLTLWGGPTDLLSELLDDCDRIMEVDVDSMPILPRAMHAVNSGRAEMNALREVLEAHVGDPWVNPGALLKFASWLKNAELEPVLSQHFSEHQQNEDTKPSSPNG